MLLAQIAEGYKVAEKIVSDSSQFGAMTYVLVVFLVIVTCERAANFWWIVRPESINRRETEKSIADSLHVFATNATTTTALLQQMVDWQKKVDSGMRELASRSHCEARDLLSLHQ